jgi:putative tricarboxylic transport membrane protein
MQSRPADLISGALIAVAGLVVWLMTRSFPELRDGHPGPALFPGVVAIALILCGGALLIQAARRRPTPDTPARLELAWPGLLRIAGAVLLGLLYPVLHDRIGFVPSAAGLILGVSLMLRARPVVSAFVALAGSVTIYLVFTRLLGVPL